MTKEQAMEARMEVGKKEGFEKMLLTPTVRLLMSQVPEAGQEVLRVLLQESFNQGFGCGSVQATLGLFEAIMKPPGPR